MGPLTSPQISPRTVPPIGPIKGPIDYFLRFFFALWGLGLIHFDATARNRANFGLWDCSPFLHRHTNVDQLDSGFAV